MRRPHVIACPRVKRPWAGSGRPPMSWAPASPQDLGSRPEPAHGRLTRGQAMTPPSMRARHDEAVRRHLLLLLLFTTLIRLAFAAALGLGVDESYMVASGRTLSLGYFDHPPAAWWLAWAASHLAGTETPIVVRLPFIALFALSTWLMVRLGTGGRRRTCRVLGGGAAQPFPRVRRHHRHLGAAGRPARLRVAGRRAMPGARPARAHADPAAPHGVVGAAPACAPASPCSRNTPPS